jgi:hypothetical protein
MVEILSGVELIGFKSLMQIIACSGRSVHIKTIIHTYIHFASSLAQDLVSSINILSKQSTQRHCFQLPPWPKSAPW